jgi:hypothetical protein
VPLSWSNGKQLLTWLRSLLLSKNAVLQLLQPPPVSHLPSPDSDSNMRVQPLADDLASLILQVCMFVSMMENVVSTMTIHLFCFATINLQSFLSALPDDSNNQSSSFSPLADEFAPQVCLSTSPLHFDRPYFTYNHSVCLFPLNDFSLIGAQLRVLGVSGLPVSASRCLPHTVLLDVPWPLTGSDPSISSSSPSPSSESPSSSLTSSPTSSPTSSHPLLPWLSPVERDLDVVATSCQCDFGDQFNHCGGFQGALRTIMFNVSLTFEEKGLFSFDD